MAAICTIFHETRADRKDVRVPQPAFDGHAHAANLALSREGRLVFAFVT